MPGCVAVQGLAGQGERDAARVAPEQFGADRGLPIGDPSACRADGQVRQFGAATDAAGAHYQAEQWQRNEIGAVQLQDALQGWAEVLLAGPAVDAPCAGIGSACQTSPRLAASTAASARLETSSLR